MARRKLPLPGGHVRGRGGHRRRRRHGYVFLSLAFRQLTTVHSKVDYTAVFGLWVVVFTLAPGFFQPLEQEVGRALAHRRAQGIGGGAAGQARGDARRRRWPCSRFVACVAAVVPITSRVFNDERAAVRLPAHRHRRVLRDLHRPRHARRATAGSARTASCSAPKGSFGWSRRSRSSSIGSHAPGAVRARARAPADRGDADLRCAVRHGLLAPGPTAPYSELSTALGYLLVGSRALPGALVLRVYRRGRAARRRRRTNLVGNLAVGHPDRAHPAPRLPSRAGRAASRSSRAWPARDATTSSARRCASSCMIVLAVGVIGIVGGFALGHASASCCSARSSRSATATSGLLAVGSGAFILALTLAQALIALAQLRGGRVVVGRRRGRVRRRRRSSSHDLFLRSELSFAIGAIGRGASRCSPVSSSQLRSGVPIGTMERLVEDHRARTARDLTVR